MNNMALTNTKHRDYTIYLVSSDGSAALVQDANTNDSAMTTEEEEMDLTVMTTEEEDDEEGPDSDDDRRGRRGRDGPLANHDWSEQADRVIMTGSDGSMMIMISGATKLAAASAATMATMTLW